MYVWVSVSDPLEMELQTVWTAIWVLRIKPRSFGRKSSVFNF